MKGHIVARKVGNKNIKLLDEMAVKILDEASKQAPTVIVQNTDRERIEQLEAENEALKNKLTELQEKMIDEMMKHNEQILKQSQKVIELTDKVLLLEQNREQENGRSFFKKIFG